jgi:transposase
MEKVIRIGIDTSKRVFQLHGVNESEEPVLRKKLPRAQLLRWFGKLEPTKIGMEACGGAHYWARELQALGHDVVLVPPQHAKPYVARGKNDAADAEAICEAMSRPKVQKRFVTVKTVDQQAAQMVIGTREQLVRRRTQLSNMLRGYAAEFGFVAPKGFVHIGPLLARLLLDPELPELAKGTFGLLWGEFAQVQLLIRRIEAQLMAFHRQSELSRRLAEIPAIGPIGAVLLAAKVTDPKAFKSGRDFAAWLGLTPKDHSTAGKLRLGGITRAGDEALRSTLVQGATAVVQVAKRDPRKASPWLLELLRRKPAKLTAVALANKTARIAWKLMVSGERYDPTRRGPHNTAAATPARQAA